MQAKNNVKRYFNKTQHFSLYALFDQEVQKFHYQYDFSRWEVEAPQEVIDRMKAIATPYYHAVIKILLMQGKMKPPPEDTFT